MDEYEKCAACGYVNNIEEALCRSCGLKLCRAVSYDPMAELLAETKVIRHLLQGSGKPGPVLSFPLHPCRPDTLFSYGHFDENEAKYLFVTHLAALSLTAWSFRITAPIAGWASWIDTPESGVSLRVAGNERGEGRLPVMYSLVYWWTRTET